MRIETRDFGAMDIDEKQVVRFVQPILGFEEQRDYVLLYDDAVGDCFIWLQSLQDKDTCFILLPPEAAVGHYCPSLPKESLELLEMEQPDQAAFRVIAVVPQEFKNATVNLKSPIVFNPQKLLAAQVVLDENYPIRARLVEQDEGVKQC